MLFVVYHVQSILSHVPGRFQVWESSIDEIVDRPEARGRFRLNNNPISRIVSATRKYVCEPARPRKRQRFEAIGSAESSSRASPAHAMVFRLPLNRNRLEPFETLSSCRFHQNHGQNSNDFTDLPSFHIVGNQCQITWNSFAIWPHWQFDQGKARPANDMAVWSDHEMLGALSKHYLKSRNRWYQCDGFSTPWMGFL